MKHIKFLLLGIFLCFTLSACNNSNQNIHSPVTYYYQASNIDYDNPNGVLVPEIREAAGHEDNYAYLIGQYLKGPISTDCISPFPDGTTLESLEVLKGKVNIVLSSQMAELTGHKLTIACTCLSKTLLDMTGLDAVTISAKDTMIDGETSITITKNDFTLTDSNEYIPDNSQ